MSLLDSVIGGLMSGNSSVSGGVQGTALQNMLGSLLGGGAQQQGGMGAVLGSLLGGGPNQQTAPGGMAGGGMGGGAMAGSLGGMLGGLLGGGQQAIPGGPSAGMGGLGGLLSQLQQAGLGHLAESWVSGGSNQPITPDQLNQALGHDRVQDMATQAGMPANDMLSQLSQLLPAAVDKLTPEGGSVFDGAGQNL